MALVPLIPKDATPEVVFQFILESNTVQIPAHLRVAPVLDGMGIEGEDPEDLTQYLWGDHQKLAATRTALKMYLCRQRGSLDLVMTTRLNAMPHTLNFYLDESDSMGWRNVSWMAAKAAGCGESLARKARRWILQYTKGDFQEKCLPLTRYGRFNTQALHDEDLSSRIQLHLQALQADKIYIRAQDIVDYVKSPEMQGCMGTKATTISINTARRWLKANKWRYRKAKKGEYVDGHEREDVIEYRNGFIKCFEGYEGCMTMYDRDGNIARAPIRGIVRL